ncbi:MAG: hypothetical protein IT210_11905 [Armatimonadetes bacterium]|nr:hypothetical protein [Armatimonadota bacterium]
MMHQRRVWQVAPAATVEELARLLTGRTWVLCQGFALQGYFFLNDATHEDGAAEFGVVRAKDLLQVESITFSWCSEGEARAYIEQVITAAYDAAAWASGIGAEQLQLPDRHGVCGHCA